MEKEEGWSLVFLVMPLQAAQVSIKRQADDEGGPLFHVPLHVDRQLAVKLDHCSTGSMNVCLCCMSTLNVEHIDQRAISDHLLDSEGEW